MNEKKRKTKSPQPAPFHKSMPKVDPDEMAFAMGVFQAGLRLKMPMESPEKSGIDAGTSEEASKIFELLPKGLQEEFMVRENLLAFRDTKMNRGALGLLAHYAQHSEREAIFVRAMAFYFLVNKAKAQLSKWTRPPTKEERDEGGVGMVMLHPAVIEAIAIAPTTNFGTFDTKKFFTVVKEIACRENIE